MNYTLDDDTSWKFIQEVLTNAGWSQEEIDEIDEETLAQVVEAINMNLAKHSDDPESPLNKYNQLMNVIASYPIETKLIGEKIVQFSENGGDVNIASLKAAYSAHEMMFFKKISDIVGEEMAIEAFKYALSAED